jgi:hypothetical protein
LARPSLRLLSTRHRLGKAPSRMLTPRLAQLFFRRAKDTKAEKLRISAPRIAYIFPNHAIR